ncbi:MAG: hypothetical protein H6730_04905 [Deltaproteobacteria bacterium]|nr:hypothetical protein [Deltaproteobacteria bacterium]
MRRVALCPGGAYPVLVATKRDVFGSQDDGDTFVRLFANPGPVDIAVTCNPKNPNGVAWPPASVLFVSEGRRAHLRPGPGRLAGQRPPRAYGVDARPLPLYSASGSEMLRAPR